MKMMNRLFVAAMLSVAASFCSAEDPSAGDYWMYWMVDYDSGTTTQMKQDVAAAQAAGYISTTASTDFNWGKLVAVVDGEKTVVSAGKLASGTTIAAVDGEVAVADLGNVSGAISSFWVEYYNYQDGALTLLGWSESITPDALSTQGAIADFRDQKYPQSAYSAWTPTEFTAVPEPTSGLLLLIGGALLALRRRRECKLNVEG